MFQQINNNELMDINGGSKVGLAAGAVATATGLVCSVVGGPVGVALFVASVVAGGISLGDTAYEATRGKK